MGAIIGIAVFLGIVAVLGMLLEAREKAKAKKTTGGNITAAALLLIPLTIVGLIWFVVGACQPPPPGSPY